MRPLRISALLACTLAGMVLMACGGDDDDASPDSTATPTPTAPGSPTASPNPLIPPLEGPQRETYLGEKQDFRQNPDYRLPGPDAVPAPSDSADPVFNLPAEAVCPSFPANHPEARIISYHVFLNGFDYFFNIALYYRWDEGQERYTDDIDEDALETALQIIGSIEFLPETTPPPTAATPGS